MYTYLFHSPIGILYLYSQDRFSLHSIRHTPLENSSDGCPILEETGQWLHAYFTQKRCIPKLPLYDKSRFTEFQKRTYDALIQVPWGKTVTYKELAGRIGSPKASRAIGNAMASNPIPILIPCHRVLGTGNNGGYGWGLEKKNWLLQHES